MGRQAQESTKAMPDSANKKALATQVIIFHKKIEIKFFTIKYYI